MLQSVRVCLRSSNACKYYGQVLIRTYRRQEHEGEREHECDREHICEGEGEREHEHECGFSGTNARRT